MSILKKIVYRLRGEFTTEKLIKMGLTVGSNFKRLHGVILDPSHCWLITIGDDVTIAPRVHILAHDASTKNYINYTRIGRVNIGNNVFIGAESVILPNVTIGDDVIIGANSTVTKDVPSGVVVAGSPAKILCQTSEYIDKMKCELAVRPTYSEEYTLRKDITEKMKQEMKEAIKENGGFVE